MYTLEPIYGFRPRERAVARHMLYGWPFKQIALELRLSEQTVKNLAKSLYDKSGMDDYLTFVVFLHYNSKAMAEVMEVPRVR